MLNKLGGLGNIGELMKKAQDLQGNMKRAKAELALIKVEGSCQNGAVTVAAQGDFVIKKVTIKPEFIDASDPELLEDLITIAVNDALDKAKKASNEKMSELTGGLNLPDIF
jgi:DNA-binding YbaB/EbfC family protein